MLFVALLFCGDDQNYFFAQHLVTVPIEWEPPKVKYWPFFTYGMSNAFLLGTLLVCCDFRVGSSFLWTKKSVKKWKKISSQFSEKYPDFWKAPRRIPGVLFQVLKVQTKRMNMVSKSFKLCIHYIFKDFHLNMLGAIWKQISFRRPKQRGDLICLFRRNIRAWEFILSHYRII